MLIVLGDSHIGSGAALGRLADQQSSWTRVCTTACEMGADVIHAGDVFHARRPGPAEMRAFQAGLEILREGERELVVALGNHDRVDMDAPTGVEAACAGYEVTVLRSSGVVEMADGPVAFLPWAPYPEARRMSDHLMILAEEMSRDARVLVAHWAIAGGALPSGLPLLELAEPMLDPHALASMFDLTLAGHIHKQQAINPGVWHMGPLCRCSFGERDVWTGCWQVANNASGPVEIPDRRFVLVESEVSESPAPTEQILDDIMDADVGDAIVRVRWSQRADQVIDTAAILASLAEYGAHRVDRLEPIVERVRSTRHEGVDENLEPAQAFDTWLEPQRDTVGNETFDRVRDTAHSWIGESA